MTAFQCKLLSYVLYCLVTQIRKSQCKETNVVKLKEKRQHDEEKIKCLVCKSVFNCDCSLKHNSANHEEFLKSSKNIPFEVFGAPKNPFTKKTPKNQ